MSYRWIVLLAALIATPCVPTVCSAEETKAEEQPACCKKEGNCSAKDGACCDKDKACSSKSCKRDGCDHAACDKKQCAGDGSEAANSQSAAGGGEFVAASCTKCKNCSLTSCECKKCPNADCDKDRCACEGNKKCTADCDAANCAADSGKESRTTAGSFTVAEYLSLTGLRDKCSGRDCQVEKTACDGPSCNGQECAGAPCRDCNSTVVLRQSGDRLFTVAGSPDTSRVSNELWDQIRSELADMANPILGVSFQQTSTDDVQSVAPCADADACGRKSAARIQYSIQIVEDCNDCMSEYDALRRGAPIMRAESKTLLPTMRVLHKHQLVRQLSSPKVQCDAGQTAQIEVAGDDDSGSIRLEVASEDSENGLMVKLAMHAEEGDQSFEVKTAQRIEPGQTIVLNATPLPAQGDSANKEPRCVYVVLTPEVVK